MSLLAKIKAAIKEGGKPATRVGPETVVSRPVYAFALEMQGELDAFEGDRTPPKSQSYLMSKLQANVLQLEAGLLGGDMLVEDVRQRCADIANYALFIAYHHGELIPSPTVHSFTTPELEVIKCPSK